MKKHNFSILSVGIPSLMLIFLLLCLVTFALLSYSSAKADDTLSGKIADRTTAYYEASNEANRTLEAVDAYLRQLYDEAEDEAAYYAGISGITEAVTDPEITVTTAADDTTTDDETTGNATADAADDATPVIRWQTPVGTDQALSVALYAQYPQQTGDTFYEITEWKIVETEEWTPDRSANVYQGDDEQKEGE